MSQERTIDDLRPNEDPSRWRVVVNLGGLFAPAALFAVGLVWVAAQEPRFAWLVEPGRYPWELWCMVTFGTVATLGGVGDWIFHRLYVAVGPKEHLSHKLALLTGGLPLFALMVAASLVPQPQNLLLPVMVVALYTATLICFDEFVFHRRRCTPFETTLHRMLVFGNGIAWLAWCHFCFVRTQPYVA